MKTDAELMKKVRNSISKGIDFLYKNQLGYGEFKTYISPDKSMEQNCKYVSTTYITSFVLYSLSFMDSPPVWEMTEKALGFLLSEMEEPGIWRFFGVNRNVRFENGNIIRYTQFGIPPDLDDTACIAYLLKKNNIAFKSNQEVFLNNRDEHGIFKTWLLEYPASKEYGEKTVYLDPHKNDLCCGVNSNVLMYLGENKYTLDAVNYINSVVQAEEEEENIPYFPDKLALYYLISRAYYNNVPSLKSSKEIILKSLSSMHLKEGSFGSALSTAFAICTLINLGLYNETIYNAFELILSTQNADGSWKKENFCVDNINYYYGSEEFSTAICIEALFRFIGGQNNEKNI